MSVSCIDNTVLRTYVLYVLKTIAQPIYVHLFEHSLIGKSGLTYIRFEHTINDYFPFERAVCIVIFTTFAYG